MEYSINTQDELMRRFVCVKQLIWTDDDNTQIDGCESFEFNELLIYIKEIVQDIYVCTHLPYYLRRL